MIPSVSGSIKTNYSSLSFRGKNIASTEHRVEAKVHEYEKKKDTVVDATIGAGSAAALTNGGKVLNAFSKCAKDVKGVAKAGEKFVVNPKFVKGPITRFLGGTLGKVAGAVGGVFAISTCAMDFSGIYNTGKQLSNK
jgi:hypothetical protein